MLITSPTTLNDGTSDHIFSLQNSKMVGSSFVTTYLELAAPIADESVVRSKYRQSSSGSRQSVAQISLNLPITDGSLKPATFNISINHHPQHTVAALTKVGKMLEDLAAEPNFWSNLIHQM